MNGILVDSCILLDLFTDDPVWADWSARVLDKYSQTNTLYINSIIYTEVSIGFNKIEEMEEAISELAIKVLGISREALFFQFPFLIVRSYVIGLRARYFSQYQ